MDCRSLGRSTEANAYFHRIEPVFLQRHFHSMHLWWDDDDRSKETRTHLEGRFSYRKTNTMLRIAIDEIQKYTYYGMSYEATDESRTKMTAGVYQESGNVHVLTAQLHQNFRLGILNWENIITYQNCNNKEVLPLPTWNIFTNLYLKFRIAKVLRVELGADATYFSKYYAPDYCPAINQSCRTGWLSLHRCLCQHDVEEGEILCDDDACE